MLKSGNVYIAEDEIKVLTELKSQLALNGINVFHKFTVTNNNIMTTCPFHKNGQEKKPSFGILIKDSGGLSAGMCHCFSCGWSGNIGEVISLLYGHDDMGAFGEKWLSKNFLTVQVEDRNDIELNFSRNEKPQNVYISDEELDKYRVYHPYMWKRKMTPEMVDYFDVGYDEQTNCLTFPVRDKKGNCLFVARRNVDYKYFNYPAGIDKPLYGIYEVERLRELPRELIVCESMINCITAWVYGKPAVALNGTGTKQQIEQLRKLPVRSYVLALDPDEAGYKGMKRIAKALPNKELSYYVIPKGKDINDLSKDEFDKLEKNLLT